MRPRDMHSASIRSTLADLKDAACAPAREGAEILDASGTAIGVVTSGGFAPSLGKAIALGFVPPAHAAQGTKLQVSVRGRAQPAEVVPTPFVPHRYFRKLKAS